MPNFLSIQRFKEVNGITTIDVIPNPHTNKLFASTEKGNFRVQGNIDNSKPMAWLVPTMGETDQEGVVYETEAAGMAAACLVNVDESKRAEPIFSL